MKLINMNCPQCGAPLEIDSDSRNVSCRFCGANFMVDDGVKHIQYDNAEQTGYEFEKGRQRARQETAENMSPAPPPQPKKRRTWLWVLGWIFIFPVPLTILLLRNDTLDKKVRIAIICAVWIVYLLIAFVPDSESSGTESQIVSGAASGQSVSANENLTSEAAEKSGDGISAYAES